jgi:hypothetical protein
MLKRSTKILTVMVSLALVFQLVACGTLIHPERMGQTGGNIDVEIAILDGIGLLFFIIPGLIAYAVDFHNGTIYLPGTSTSSLDMPGIEDTKQVKFDPGHDAMATVERIIKEETGHDVELYRDRLEVSELRSIDDMMAHFAKVLPGTKYTRVALSIQ